MTITPGDRISWIQRHIINPRTRQPIELLDFQTEFIEGIYADGILSGGYSLPRKNGKTGLLAALALAELDLNADADVVLGATKVKQASRASGVFGVMKTFVRLGDLSHMKVSRNNNAPFITNSLTGCTAEAVSFGDEDAAQGLNPSLCVLDEFGTAFWTPERWGAAVMSMGGRDGARVIGISTPSSQDSAMYDLRTKVMAGQTNRFYWQEHSAPLDLDPYDPVTWAIANPALGHFLTIDSLEQDASLPEVLFRMFRLGQWIDSYSLDGWLGVDGAKHWDATAVDVELDPDEPVFIGVDKSAYDDFSAVVALQRHEDRWLSKLFVFRPNPTVDHAAVKQTLRDLCKTYRVQAIGFDDRYFVEGAQELEAEGLPMEKVPQSAQRLVPAYSALHKAITEGLFMHDEDDDYRAAALSAVPKVQDGGGFTLSKNRSKTKIDPIVATAIAIAVYAPEQPFRYFL